MKVTNRQPRLCHLIVKQMEKLDQQARQSKNVAPVSGYVAGQSPLTETMVELDSVTKEMVGPINRRVAHENGILHPTVHLLLFNQKDQLLLQKRGENKDSSPGKLSQSVGGHVAYRANVSLDELVAAAFAKEAQEELGIETLPDLKYFYWYPYESQGGKNREWVRLAVAEYNGKLTPNTSELLWVGWFDYQSICRLAATEQKLFAPSFLTDLELYQILSYPLFCC
jgi:isopentenyl-diphosphate delta-isomerase